MFQRAFVNQSTAAVGSPALRNLLAALGMGLALMTPAAMMVAFSTPVAAQELDDGSKARINLAGKLAMLSQRVAGAACRLNSGIDISEAASTLHDAQIEVRAILDGLEKGDMSLGIPTPERRSRTLRALRDVRGNWKLISDGIDRLLADTANPAHAQTIIRAAGSFEDASELLASEIAAYYSNPNELLFVDAMAIELAARQRMLSQRISAETCFLAAGADENTGALTSATDLFERTLVALRDGLPTVGVRKPPNDAVHDKISASWELWRAERASIDPLLSGGDADIQLVADIAHISAKLEKDMNDLVILYILSTPGRDGAIRGVLQDMAENELSRWVADPALIAAVKRQNDLHAALGQDAIDALDKQWRAEAKGSGGALINDLMSRELSKTLQTRQVATAGFINEIFVMDFKGLNVAQSAVTSDYWQGDEAKWQETFGNGSGAVHISDVEFDESTGVFQSQVSIPVKDLETGELLGAMTFGVNVQSLL